MSQLKSIGKNKPVYALSRHSIESCILMKGERNLNAHNLSEKFDLHFPPHQLAVTAAEDLQKYLMIQKDWEHNFGLKAGQAGTVIGKMFGVLVVQTTQNELKYLAAFSGKLAGTNEHKRFVPPVFDGLSEQSFVNEGMREISRLNIEIKALKVSPSQTANDRITQLKIKRRNHSATLQGQIFEQYHFLNQSGVKKSLNQIFKEAGYKNPPSGAGECAGPKLFQYAYLHQLKPIALTEFWWGLSPKSDKWKHGHFYACCEEKCRPILNYMLAD